MRIVRLLLAVVVSLLGLSALGASPRRVRVEVVGESCFVSRGHPLFPRRFRVVECRLEVTGETLVVRGTGDTVLLGPHASLSNDLATLRAGATTEIAWSTLDGFDLLAAALLLVTAGLFAHDARRRDPEEAYVDELVRAFGSSLPARGATCRDRPWLFKRRPTG